MEPIKSNEVMVGNWVMRSVTGLVYNPYRISKGSDVDNCEHYAPIPLTEEILLKCGFELDASYQVPQWSNETGFFFHDKLEDYPYSVRLMNRFDIEIKHLHQLQNLYFTLTQTHLNIQL